MKKNLIFSGLLLALCISSCTCFLRSSNATLQDRTEDWVLVFNDEFDGPEVDTNKWTVAYNMTHTDEEQQIYFPENAYTEDGNLVIQTIYKPTLYYPTNRTYDYQSAWLDTQYHKTFMTGKFEARILLPATGHDDPIWPAFWMMGNGTYWPNGSEIDVMELSSGWSTDLEPHIYGSYHFGPSYPDICFASGTVYPQQLDFTQYHVYSVVWTENEIDWYVDGNLYKSYQQGGTYINCREPIVLPKFEQFLILNDAIDNFATPNPASYPKYMKVDYVRVYQEASTIKQAAQA